MATIINNNNNTNNSNNDNKSNKNDDNNKDNNDKNNCNNDDDDNDNIKGRWQYCTFQRNENLTTIRINIVAHADNPPLKYFKSKHT